MLNNKSILITGGTGSLGKELTKYIINQYPEVKRLIIYSRDEQKQFQMAQDYPKEQFPQIVFFIGDVRDKDRLRKACHGIDFIIHTAAMKHMPIAESNPEECIKTNINGAQNLIDVSIEMKVERVVSLSTDKAVAPINLYGATKLVADKLFIAANNSIANEKTIFSIVRFGNIFGSEGSVVPFFLKKKKEGKLPITNLEMTRFNITFTEAIDIILYALKNAWGGEVFLPKSKSYRIKDLAEAICPDCEQVIVGNRPGEKIHEDLLSDSDLPNIYEISGYYVLLPENSKWDRSEYVEYFKSEGKTNIILKNSENNTEWETIKSLEKQIYNLKQ